VPILRWAANDGQRDEWVVAIHFDDEKALQDWLGSAMRAQ
jgi:antibiotic biosynthesis monooxygenase (ABM) superfamily enzyme